MWTRAFPEWQKLDDHVEKECPLTEIECDFHYAGCEVRLPRRNMPDHLKDGLVAHFSLLAMSHKRQQDEIQALNKTHQEEIKALERRQEEKIMAITGEIDKLKVQTEQLRLNTQTFPIDFTVRNPDTFINARSSWRSTPFYSHNQGYKLCIVFFKNFWFGHYIQCDLMQGDFDSLLNWPLKAVMKLALLNQQPLGHDYEFTIQLNYSKRLGDGAAAVECGSYLVDLISLKPYLHNRCLHIRIVGIQFLGQMH